MLGNLGLSGLKCLALLTTTNSVFEGGKNATDTNFSLFLIYMSLLAYLYCKMLKQQQRLHYLCGSLLCPFHAANFALHDSLA